MSKTKKGIALIKRMINFLFMLLLLTPMSSTWALAPLESLVLGNFSENYSESETDPLNYVFSRDKYQSTEAGFKRDLALYRGFYEEGKNTLNYCKVNREIQYTSDWEKIQVMRSMLSEIQYIGLDLTARAIPQYAKALEFTRDEYLNLIDGLVGNYCSANLSVISKKELKNNLLIKFDKDNSFILPNVSNNPFFPSNLDSYLPPKTALEEQFKYTVKLFQSICSWGGNPTNPGLMVPILKHPALMAFFTRQMDNQVIEWKELSNTLFLKEDKNTVQVVCDNLICRKTFRENFYNKIYHSVGGTQLSEDLKRLYCEEFKNVEYKPSESDERLKKIMNARTFDEENFINSQFISLITGVPDFFLGALKFNQGEDIFRSSLDSTWSKWATSQTETLNRELYFEEPLTLELIERRLYFNPRRPVLKVAFDVNLGEFDRINQKAGKVSVRFTVNLQKSFLNYYRESLKNLGPQNKSDKEYLLKRFKIQMTKDLNNAREKFLIPPWKGDLELIIANELTEQMQLIPDEKFKMSNTGFLPVTIEMNYGIFALKYINHQKTVQNARDKGR